LIDIDRAYLIMNKIKEIAVRQIEKGIKEIDYSEIVIFLRENEGNNLDEHSKNNYNVEPKKTKVPLPEDKRKDRW
jgi:hypothetical protein